MQTEQEVKQDELQEALRLLYANVLTSTAVSAFVSTVFVFGLSFSIQENYFGKLIWWLIMIAGLSLRLLDMVRYRKKSSQHYIASDKDLWRFFCLSFFFILLYIFCFPPF